MNAQTFHFLETLNQDSLFPLLSSWHERHPSGAVIALVAESEAPRLPLLQAACRAQGLDLAGAVFPGLIRDETFVNQGAHLLLFPDRPPHALIDRLSAESPASRIAAALPAELVDPESPAILFMMFDAMVPNIASILDDLYLELADGVRYLGANAGSETFQPMPCLFDAERVTGDAVLCLLLPGDWKTALTHGYRAPDDLIAATATQGNKIVSIDWKPAFAVYRDKVLERYGVALDHENFYRYGVHFPFGIELANGQTLVRIPVAMDEDDGILCIGEVPGNSLLTLLQSPEVDSLDTARSLAERLRASRPAAPWLLLFYCAGRRLHLGAAATRELTACALEMGSTPVGALTLGEIGSLGEGAYPLFHNASLVGLSWKASGGDSL